MNKRKQLFAALPGIAILTAFSINVGAQVKTPQAQQQMKEQVQERERIYGSQLMTEQERNAQREKMRQATSQEERERIRAEHYRQMQQRAQKQGITLPEVPPARGMGQGMGRSQGMGPGGEMAWRP